MTYDETLQECDLTTGTRSTQSTGSFHLTGIQGSLTLSQESLFSVLVDKFVLDYGRDISPPGKIAESPRQRQ
jgi:hypothetical protein